MKLTVHLEGADRAELVKGLKAHLALIEGAGTTETVTAPPKRGRPPGGTTAAPAEEFDLGFDGEGAAVETTETEEEAAPTYEDVIDALKAYAGKNGKEKAGKVLAKFKVKSVKDLKEAQYKDILVLLA
jgi:hypothetical protein